MCDVVVKIPKEILYDTKMSIAEANSFAREMLALGYYTKKKVSLSYCAQIAGMSKQSFIEFLGQNGVSIFRFDSEDELLRDVHNA